MLSCNPSHFKVYKCCLNTQHHSMKFSLFWDVIQHRLVVSFWRFGTTYQSKIQASSSPRRMIGLHDPWRWDRYVVPKRQYLTSNIHCINIPEKRRYHLHHGRSLKAHNTTHKTTQHFNIITSSMPTSSDWFLPFWFFEQNLVWIYHPSHAKIIEKQFED